MQRTTMSPYTTLHVLPSTPLEEVKKAYYRLAKQYHPDICKDADAPTKMQQLNAAYEAIKGGSAWSYIPPAYTPPDSTQPWTPVMTLAEKIAYAQTHAVSEQFLIDLLVGGRDKYSSMSLLDLVEACDVATIQLVEKLLHQQRTKTVALRWHLRGLRIMDAIRKAKLDDRLYNRKGNR